VPVDGERAYGGKHDVDPFGADGIEPHRLVEIAEPEPAREFQDHAGHRAGFVDARTGHKDLTAVGRRHHTRGLVNGQRDIVLTVRRRQSGVDSHAYSRPFPVGPRFRLEEMLCLSACLDGRRRVGERAET